jgi:hypothetical protein
MNAFLGWDVSITDFFNTHACQGRALRAREISIVALCYIRSPCGPFTLGADLETHVEFRSDRFQPLEGEENFINPDLWGKRLADFLREGLARQGFETKEPIAEDWGWVVPVVNKPFRLWIGCGHYQEYEDGFLCFIEPHKPFVWRMFKRVDTRERIAALRQAMDRVLVEREGIRSKRWWTHEGFNKPSLDGQKHA